MTIYKYLLPPLIGAVIGWVTNYAAIKLLFKPHRPIKIFGFEFQGLIPKRRKEIATTIAHAIEKEILSKEDIASMLGDIEWKREVEHVMEDLVEHRFGSSRLKRLPVIGLLSENITYHIKYLLTKEVLRQIDAKKETIVNRFREKLDLKEVMISKIDSLDLVSFERLLSDIIAKELKHLEYLGAVMGFFIGVVQSVIFYLIG
jgi:uncharacterized membrane protein YheB (UPF0754 family)